MKPTIFVFTGVCHNESHPDLAAFKDILQPHLQQLSLILNMSVTGNQLMLSLTNPDFRYYISLITQKQLKDIKELARDFELPWDRKEITRQRLTNIYNVIEKEGWFPFKPYPEVGFVILDELKKLGNITPYSVPSMDN